MNFLWTVLSILTVLSASEVDELQKKCDGGDRNGCFDLGVIYDNGQGLKQNYFKAAEFYQKSCKRGDARGCFNLGASYENGKGIYQSDEKALKFYGKACDLEDSLGCKNYIRLNKEMKN